jgi:hypothetical protein
MDKFRGDTRVLTVTLSILTKQLARMPPGIDRDIVAAEVSELKAELLARQQERRARYGKV